MAPKPLHFTEPSNLWTGKLGDGQPATTDLMTTGQRQTLINKFVWYMGAWHRVHDEYLTTPGYRWLHQLRLLNKLHMLTSEYERELAKYTTTGTGHN